MRIIGKIDCDYNGNADSDPGYFHWGEKKMAEKIFKFKYSQIPNFNYLFTNHTVLLC